MYLYIFFEITYLILIVINFVFNKYSEIFKIGPAIISVIYLLINKNKTEKINIYLVLSIIFSLVGDIFFLLIDKHILGISSFIMVQMFYLFFQKEKSTNISILIFLNFLACTIFGKKIITIEVIFYAVIFIMNIIFCSKNIRNKKISPLFLLALLSLLICDINVAIINKIDLSKSLKTICSSIEWIFYTLYLIVITLFAKGILKIKSN